MTTFITRFLGRKVSFAGGAQAMRERLLANGVTEEGIRVVAA